MNSKLVGVTKGKLKTCNLQTEIEIWRASLFKPTDHCGCLFLLRNWHFLAERVATVVAVKILVAKVHFWRLFKIKLPQKETCRIVSQNSVCHNQGRRKFDELNLKDRPIEGEQPRHPVRLRISQVILSFFPQGDTMFDGVIMRPSVELRSSGNHGQNDVLSCSFHFPQ